MDYQVSLDVFEGPLDLLLRLIERQELDITLVSLALVADQFLAQVTALEDVSAENLANFLVIAARLLVIKSRVLLPQPEQEEEEEETWGEELVDRLQEYKRFKEAAARLRELEQRGRHLYPRLAPPPKIEPRLRTGEGSVDELVQALRRVLEARPRVAPVDEVVSPIVVHITDCIRHILQRLKRYGRLRFSTLMRRARSKVEVIVHFLAMLELIKLQRVRAIQERPFAEIYLEPREPDPGAEVPPLDLSEYGEGEAQLTVEGLQ